LRLTQAVAIALLTGALQGFGADLGSLALSRLSDNPADQQDSLVQRVHSSDIQ